MLQSMVNEISSSITDSRYGV